MKKNDVVRLTVTGLTNEGNGVGRVDGMAVFVPNTAAGDEAQVRIVKLHPHYAYGRLEKLLTPSPDRINPDCPVSRRCGGCSLRHISYEAEKREKWTQVHDAFTRIGGFSSPCRPLISTGQVDGYRNKAMLPVRCVDGHAAVGFYAKRSHDLVECEDCRLQPEEFSRAAQVVRDFLEENQISCYDEASGQGFVRHLYLRKAFATGQLMICLVINGESFPNADRLLARLHEAGVSVTSLTVNINKENTNVILGKRTVPVWGSPFIEDVLCGVRVRLQPQSFYQVNREAAELLYQKAADYAGLDGTQTLVDLYCGAGTIGLSMAGKLSSLIGVEVVPSAVEDAQRNARLCGVQNARFICADASQAARQLVQEGIRPDVVVVDPTRKGCEEAVLQSIAEMRPQRIVMISCNPATAARDCKRLTERGYVLVEITPVDLFPRTTHVECVCAITKKEK